MNTLHLSTKTDHEGPFSSACLKRSLCCTAELCPTSHIVSTNNSVKIAEDAITKNGIGIHLLNQSLFLSGVL